MSSPRTRCRAWELLHESAQNLRDLPTPKWVKLDSPVPHPPVPHVPSGRGSPAAAGHCAGPHSLARERHPKQVKWIGHHVEEPERDPGAFPPLPKKVPSELLVPPRNPRRHQPPSGLTLPFGRAPGRRRGGGVAAAVHVVVGLQRALRRVADVRELHRRPASGRKGGSAATGSTEAARQVLRSPPAPSKAADPLRTGRAEPSAP